MTHTVQRIGDLRPGQIEPTRKATRDAKGGLFGSLASWLPGLFGKRPLAGIGASLLIVESVPPGESRSIGILSDHELPSEAESILLGPFLMNTRQLPWTWTRVSDSYRHVQRARLEEAEGYPLGERLQKLVQTMHVRLSPAVQLQVHPWPYLITKDHVRFRDLWGSHHRVEHELDFETLGEPRSFGKAPDWVSGLRSYERPREELESGMDLEVELDLGFDLFDFFD